MPGDERDEVGAPNDGRGQAKPPQPAPCPECGRHITIKADGTMRHHTDQGKPRDAGIWSPRCAGSGKQPQVEI